MSDLRGDRAPAKIKFGLTGKIVGAILVISVVGALAGYGYEAGMFKSPPKPVVSDDELPTTAPPSGQ